MLSQIGRKRQPNGNTGRTINLVLPEPIDVRLADLSDKQTWTYNRTVVETLQAGLEILETKFLN